MKKLIPMFVVLLLSVSLLQKCTTEHAADSLPMEKITLLLDWTPNTNHTGLFVAQAENYYKEEGLEVEIIQASEGGTSQLIGAEQGTFGLSYQEEMVYAREKEIPIVAVATILQHNTSGFASPVEKGIITPKDFENKTYGGWGSPAEIAMIKALMEKYHADVSTVKIATIGAADFFIATQKEIDFTWIYYGWDGIAAEIRKKDIHFIDLGKEDSRLDFYTPVIIAHEKTIKENPELIKKFLRATRKGYEFAIQDPTKAAEILCELFPELDHELILRSQEWVSKKYIDDASRWGYMENNRWVDYTQWLYSNQLITTLIDSSRMFTNDYLPD